MASQWLAGAQRVLGESSGPAAAGAGPKIVHHTTEGSSAAGAIAAYRASRSWPTLTAEWTGARLRVFQHMPLNAMARALEHPSGPETNRADVVQIEHVGFTSDVARRAARAPASLHVSHWPEARWRAIASLCRQIEHVTGCPARSLVPEDWWKVPQRLDGQAFFAGEGHCGHCHVPRNRHTDGEGFRIALIAVDDVAHRTLKLGDRGSDVQALQLAIRARANGCGRPDRMPVADGVYGAQTKTAAAFVGYVLGVGSSQARIVAGGLSANSQRLIRHPELRTVTQKRRAGARRRKYCKGGKSS